MTLLPKLIFAGLLGSTVVLAAQATAVPPRPDGGLIFRQRCQSCHTVEAGKAGVLGPNLRAVVGRKAAATAFNYSPALKGSNVTWTRTNLDRYLSGPGRMVPGTRMVIAVADAQQRAALLDYLANPPR